MKTTHRPKSVAKSVTKSFEFSSLSSMAAADLVAGTVAEFTWTTGAWGHISNMVLSVMYDER